MRRRKGYLTRRGKVYYAVWTVNGKKFRQSTGQRDRRNAETEMRRIMEPFVAGDEVATLQNIKARIEGRSAEIARIENERNPPLTVARAWAAYLSASDRPDSGERTLSDYAGYWSAFTDWLKQKHKDVVALRDVTATVAGEYARHLAKDRGLSGNSFNKHIGFLKLLYRVLKDRARLEGSNPWTGIRRKRAVSVSRRELTTDELRAMCGAASGELRLLFGVGIYTGLRLGDCCTLRWGEVDLPQRLIRRVPNKIARRNPRPVIVPIHADLAGMLSEIPASERGEYVLPDYAAMYLADTSATSRRIHDHFEACGVKTHRPGTGDGTDKRAVVEVGFHSLRHTFVSLCREADAPLAVVESIVGHASPAMTRHYTHVGESAAAVAINGLPSVLVEPGAPRALPSAKLIEAKPVRALTEKLTAKNWRKVRRELLKIVDAA